MTLKRVQKRACIYNEGESHVGTDFAPFRFFYKKTVIHAVVPPFSQKGTLGLGCSLINAFETFFCRCYPFARKAPSAVYKRYDLPGHIIKKCRTQKSLGLNAMEKIF
jgi:hypothetical protein